MGCYFTVGDQTFTSDILLNTNEPNFRTFFEFDCQAKDTPYTLECYDQDMMLPLKREEPSGNQPVRRVHPTNLATILH
jgi:hypothetical protein